MSYQIYEVNARNRGPLIQFMVDALHDSGCTVIYRSSANEAPFRLTFETPYGERLGIVAYAFFANQKVTKNRPTDEHRFQIKYGSKAKEWHELWQDPYSLYTTLLIGINPDRGFFVSADPVLHSPTRFFISLEFKQQHVDEILRKRWHVWERVRRSSADEPTEVLVGGTANSFLRCLRFEREALGEDQGHRQLVAEQLGAQTTDLALLPSGGLEINVPQSRLHALAREFELTEAEVLDLIESAPRLKMAVRGWVAEEHLVRVLRDIPGVSDCDRLSIEGGADVTLRYRGSTPIIVECKNVLRNTLADGTPRLDFQRTRTSKADPCSRYYRPEDFDMVAACLHPITEHWEYRFAQTGSFEPHPKCKGRLSQNVRIEKDRWTTEIAQVLNHVSSNR